MPSPPGSTSPRRPRRSWRRRRRRLMPRRDLVARRSPGRRWTRRIARDRSPRSRCSRWAPWRPRWSSRPPRTRSRPTPAPESGRQGPPGGDADERGGRQRGGQGRAALRADPQAARQRARRRGRGPRRGLRAGRARRVPPGADAARTRRAAARGHDARPARVLLRPRALHRQRRARRRACSSTSPRSATARSRSSYGLFVAGDRPCCPSGGEAEVRFRWTGDELEPREEIPPTSSASPPGH